MVSLRRGVLMLEHREAGADYVLQLSIGLAQAGVNAVVVGTPQYRAKAAEISLPGSVTIWPYFNLAQNAGMRNAVPFVWGWARTLVELIRRRPRVLHVQWLVRPGPESRFIPLIARAVGARLVYTAHNVVPHAGADRSLEAALRRFYRSCDAVIVHTRRSREDLLARFPGVEPTAVRVIEHGNYEHRLEDIDRATARRLLGLPDDALVVSAVGKVRSYKGVEDLILALDGGPPGAVLLVAGHPDDPAHLQQLHALAQRVGVQDRVRFVTRYLSNREMQSAFVAADVVALPYRAIDQSGILLYAMSCGRAIVASRLPSFAETLEEGAGALFHEPGDVAALRDALRTVLSDGALRDALGREAQRVAVTRHAWDVIGRRTAEVYRDVSRRGRVRLD
jgi:glycosyltransferase involved in cell wall biosynthesis